MNQSRVWALIGLIALTACRHDAAEAEKKRAAGAGSRDPKQVKLVAVEARQLDQLVTVSGTLAADEHATVATKVSGRLASISIDLASAVQRGQPIAQIDPADFKLRVDQTTAQLAQARAELGLDPGGSVDQLDIETTAVVKQARATLDEAKSKVERARSLAQEGIMTSADKDAAEAAYARAESGLQSALEQVKIRQAAVKQRLSELKMAQQQLADTVVTSPLAGIVQVRRANVGEFLQSGAPIAEVVRIDPLRLRVAVPEREANGIQPGQLVRVRVDGDAAEYTGKVARLAPALDPQSRTLLCEADIANPGKLRPGSFARAEIVVGSRVVPTVPTSAIVRFAGIEKVLQVASGKAVEKAVETGKTSGDRIEIVSGVKAGELVVLVPGSLQQGQSVRVAGGG
jgi:HlyD family secretion protein